LAANRRLLFRNIDGVARLQRALDLVRLLPGSSDAAASGLDHVAANGGSFGWRAARIQARDRHVANVVSPRDLHRRLARVEASQVEHAPVPGIKPMSLIKMASPSTQGTVVFQRRSHGTCDQPALFEFGTGFLPPDTEGQRILFAPAISAALGG
jgi:hypothetical protein